MSHVHAMARARPPEPERAGHGIAMTIMRMLRILANESFKTRRRFGHGDPYVGVGGGH
jgi:hypothetical protein